jgi:hypothetical protein
MFGVLLIFFYLRGDTMLGTPQLKIQANELVQENPLLPKSLTNQLCAQ